MALEMDMHTNDIDICVVSETHLRLDVPDHDAVIAMSNYALYRRDRNWSGREMRKNGGISTSEIISQFSMYIYLLPCPRDNIC